MQKIKVFLTVLFLVILSIPTKSYCADDRMYNGLLIDAMAQIDETVDSSIAIQRVKRAGISKIALFARSRRYLSENEQAVISIKKNNPNLIILGSPKYFLLRNDLEKEYISHTLKNITKHNYQFIGEILYSHADKSHGEQTRTGERYVDPLAYGTNAFLNSLLKYAIPIMTHWEVYAWERDWPRFKKLYFKNRDQKFLIPHMAFAKPSQVEEILSCSPNVFMTISKKEKDKRAYSDRGKAQKLGSGFIRKNGVLRNKWRFILEKYQDRLLFATDAHKRWRWQKYEKVVKRHRKILGQLKVSIAKKIAYKNAEKLYGVTAN
ncbi:MAG: hypothetical protein CMM44_02935 [Rhodospirillaceae bacterium]|nr:hypothetical protein [Rhodospirillaceae bacterium]|tara:strand:- start:1766 stop:2725 length:960 start_codon:yes stop_codon:yes gene_type:complete